MPVKRRLPKERTRRLTPELRVKAKRLLALNEDHLQAIRGFDEAFYEDGRHHELCDLISEVYPALDIWPHQDAYPIIEAALEDER